MRGARTDGSAFASYRGVTSTSGPRILIVEDEQCIRDVLVELFDVSGSTVLSADSLDRAKALLASEVFDLIVTDIRLGGRREGGLQVMASAGVLSPGAVVIALTAYPDENNRLASMRLGATHFLEKPISLHAIAQVAGSAGVPTALTPHATKVSPWTDQAAEPQMMSRG